MDRARRRGEAFVQRAEEAAEKFIEAVERLPRMRTYYERGMRHDHKSAVLQHYGFPTTFLDLTFSFDIALFFAELREPGTDPPRHGAIFAIPTYRLPMQSAIVTLPPAIMRPNLQLGKFLDAADPHVVESLEEHKFRFAQRKTQVSNGIGRVGFSTIPGLNDYLFPRSDPLEGIAQPLLDELFNTEVE
jgi:hypothetical protein